jgi:hypothetical protein
VICPPFFTDSAIRRARVLIHELVHQTSGDIPDLAYESDRYYNIISTADALRNAESYAEVAQEIATGQPTSRKAPTDKHNDCPADWSGALDRAIAIAQRWNRKGKDLLHSPTDSANFSNLISTHLGSNTPAAIDHARSVYDGAADKLRDSVPFECEVGATGGRCKTSTLYWYMSFFGHNLHVCPKWMELGNDTDRATDLLSGFYGYQDLGRDWDDRGKIVALAREFAKKTGTDPHPVAPPAANPSAHP